MSEDIYTRPDAREILDEMERQKGKPLSSRELRESGLMKPPVYEGSEEMEALRKTDREAWRKEFVRRGMEEIKRLEREESQK